MDLLTAHGMFALRSDAGRGVLPEELDLTADVAPAVATAMVVLSGRLDECRSDRDLDDAAAHFRSLWRAEVVTLDQLRAETREVVSALLNDPTLAAMDAAHADGTT